MAVVISDMIRQLWENGCTCPAHILPDEAVWDAYSALYTFRHITPCPFFPYSFETRELEAPSE